MAQPSENYNGVKWPKLPDSARYSPSSTNAATGYQAPQWTPPWELPQPRPAAPTYGPSRPSYGPSPAAPQPRYRPPVSAPTQQYQSFYDYGTPPPWQRPPDVPVYEPPQPEHFAPPPLPPQPEPPRPYLPLLMQGGPQRAQMPQLVPVAQAEHPAASAPLIAQQVRNAAELIAPPVEAAWEKLRDFGEDLWAKREASRPKSLGEFFGRMNEQAQADAEKFFGPGNPILDVQAFDQTQMGARPTNFQGEIEQAKKLGAVGGALYLAQRPFEITAEKPFASLWTGAQVANQSPEMATLQARDAELAARLNTPNLSAAERMQIAGQRRQLDRDMQFLRAKTGVEPRASGGSFLAPTPEEQERYRKEAPFGLQLLTGVLYDPLNVVDAGASAIGDAHRIATARKLAEPAVTIERGVARFGAEPKTVAEAAQLVQAGKAKWLDNAAVEQAIRQDGVLVQRMADKAGKVPVLGSPLRATPQMNMSRLVDQTNDFITSAFERYQGEPEKYVDSFLAWATDPHSAAAEEALGDLTHSKASVQAAALVRKVTSNADVTDATKATAMDRLRKAEEALTAAEGKVQTATERLASYANPQSRKAKQAQTSLQKAEAALGAAQENVTRQQQIVGELDKGLDMGRIRKIVQDAGDDKLLAIETIAAQYEEAAKSFYGTPKTVKNAVGVEKQTYQLPEKTAVRKFRDGLTQFVNLFFMGYNPGYAFRNAANNLLTAVADGVNPLTPEKAMSDFFVKWGKLPMATMKGIGSAGDVEKGTVAARELYSRAQQPMKAWEPIIGGLKSWKNKPMAAMAQEFESLASQRIMYANLDRFWGQVWPKTIKEFRKELTANPGPLAPQQVEYFARRLENALNPADVKQIVREMRGAQQDIAQTVAPEVAQTLRQAGGEGAVQQAQQFAKLSPQARTVAADVMDLTADEANEAASAVTRAHEVAAKPPELPPALPASAQRDEVLQFIQSNAKPLQDYLGQLREIERNYIAKHRETTRRIWKSVEGLNWIEADTLWQHYWDNTQRALREVYDALDAVEDSVGPQVGFTPQAIERAKQQRAVSAKFREDYAKGLRDTWSKSRAAKNPAERNAIWDAWYADSDGRYRVKEGQDDAFIVARSNDITEAIVRGTRSGKITPPVSPAAGDANLPPPPKRQPPEEPPAATPEPVGPQPQPQGGAPSAAPARRPYIDPAVVREGEYRGAYETPRARDGQPFAPEPAPAPIAPAADAALLPELRTPAITDNDLRAAAKEAGIATTNAAGDKPSDKWLLNFGKKNAGVRKDAAQLADLSESERQALVDALQKRASAQPPAPVTPQSQAWQPPYGPRQPYSAPSVRYSGDPLRPYDVPGVVGDYNLDQLPPSAFERMGVPSDLWPKSPYESPRVTRQEPWGVEPPQPADPDALPFDEPPPSAAPRQLQGATGNTVTAYGTDPNRQYQFRYKVVSLDDLTPSQTDAMTPNPAYPAELQPRIRDRAASRLQIEQIAAKLQPDGLLGNFNSLDRGPMIVGPDTAVESGNGRVMALRKARADVPERWQAYQTRLTEVAPEYGIDPQEVAKIKDPVLVRERVSDVDRVQFSAEANEQATLAMSPVEQALQDAGRVQDRLLATLEVGDGQSVDQALTSAVNKPIVRAFVEAIPANERAALVTAEGSLNAQGLGRLKSALFAKTYPGDAGQRLAQTFIESLDPNIKNIEAGMFASLPKMSKAESLVRSGERAAELALGDDLAAAVDMLARLKEQGVKVTDYLAQGALFEDELTPFQKEVLEYLDTISRKPKAVRESLNAYADAVEAAPNPGQMGMFGDEAAPSLTKEDILGRIRQEQSANPAEQYNLFGDEPIGQANRPTFGKQGQGLAQPPARTGASPIEGAAGAVGPTRTFEYSAPWNPRTGRNGNAQPFGVMDARASALEHARPVWRNLFGAPSQPVPQLTPEQALYLFNFIDKKILPRMGQDKYLVGQIATEMRNFALGDYSQRRNIHELLQWIYPYSYWYSFTVPNWAVRLTQHPSYIAHYARYKRLLRDANREYYRTVTGDPNAELPEWNESSWFITLPFTGTQFQINIEDTLNPLKALLLPDYDAKEIAKAGPNVPGLNVPLGTLYNKLNAFGPTTHPLYGWLFAVALANGWFGQPKNEAAAAQLWGYTFPQERVLKGATAAVREMLPGADKIIPAGGWTPSMALPWNKQGAYYDLRQVPRYLVELYKEGKVTPEAMQAAGYTWDGKAWDDAKQKQALAKLLPVAASFFLGQGFKPRDITDIQIEQMWADRGKIFDLPKPEQKAAWDAWRTKYPWGDVYTLARERDPQKRLESFTWLVLNRLPPGKQGTDLKTQAGLSEDLVSKWFATGYDLSTWTPQEQDAWQKGIEKLAGITNVPDDKTKAEYKTAKDQKAQVDAAALAAASQAAGRTVTAEEWQTANAEYANAKTPQEKDAVLAKYPYLKPGWDAKREAKTTAGPEYQKYYPDKPLTAEQQAKADLAKKYTEAEKKFGTKVAQWADEYSNLPKGAARTAWIKANPEKWQQVKAFYDFIYPADKTTSTTAKGATSGAGVSTGKLSDAAKLAQRYDEADAKFGKQTATDADNWRNLTPQQKANFKQQQPARYANLQAYWNYVYGDNRTTSSKAGSSRYADNGGGRYAPLYSPYTSRGGGGRSYSSYSGGRSYGGSYGGGYGGTSAPSAAPSPAAPPTPAELPEYDKWTAGDFGKLLADERLDDPAFDTLVSLMFGGDMLKLAGDYYGMDATARAEWIKKNPSLWARLLKFLLWLLKQKGVKSDYGAMLQSIPPGVQTPNAPYWQAPTVPPSAPATPSRTREAPPVPNQP